MADETMINGEIYEDQDVTGISGGRSGPQEPHSLRQVRSGSPSHVRVMRSRTSLLDMYRDDLRLVGVDPSPLAGQVIRDVASLADADFMDRIGWAELTTRTNSAAAEAALLSAEVIFRANNFRKQYVKDSKVFNTTSAELKCKIADLSLLLEKEMANSKRREKEMRLGFETQRLKLQNELRVAEVRLKAAAEEARKAKEEKNSAQLDAELARAELKLGKETFKEAFLKSEEFGEIIGDKALSFLNVGFDGCVEQFRTAGYPPEDTSADFLDVNKVIDSLPEEM